MNQSLTWTKSIFSNTSEIFSKGQKIGQLKENYFSNSGLGEINNEVYKFHTQGVFCPTTSIVQKSTNEIIGKIKYNSWMTKASIMLVDKQINWRYSNIWNTRWSLSDKGENHINYFSMGKRIEGKIEDPLLLLTGLFVSNYYQQTGLFVILASQIPIWITLFS